MPTEELVESSFSFFGYARSAQVSQQELVVVLLLPLGPRTLLAGLRQQRGNPRSGLGGFGFRV